MHRLGRGTVGSAFVAIVALIAYLLWPNSVQTSNPQQKAIRDAALASWKGYRKCAWGKDIYSPISCSGHDILGKPMGWLIIDSLDTLMLMGFDSYVAESRKWIKNNLDFAIAAPMSVFETTIRMLGGLLSCYYLSGDPLYLEKATDLGERLLPAFHSRSGLAYPQVNLAGGRSSYMTTASTSEVATLQLEFKYLAELTGREEFWRAAETAMRVIDENDPPSGLPPISISTFTGKFLSSEIRLGSRGDSYYEYLIKQYLHTNFNEPIYREMYHEAVDGILEHLVAFSHPNGLQFIGEREYGLDSELSNKMDHLVCFAGGMLALGATNGKSVEEAKKDGWSKRQQRDLEFAANITKTCAHMYLDTETGLSPEIVVFETNERSTKDFRIKPLDKHCLQRPETVESLFIMYRLTGDPIYRQWGWEIFKAFDTHAKLANNRGYVGLRDVTNVHGEKIDNMESFWMAETLKYLYLLFDDNNTWPLDKIVFNTEAHPLPILSPSFRTGWSRRSSK